MTTKNIYAKDTIIANLLYSIQKGETNVAIECANELTISKEHDALWNTLTFAWILSNPEHKLENNHVNAFLSKNANQLLMSLLDINGYELPEFYIHYDIKLPTRHASKASIPWTKIPSGWSNDQACVLWNTIKKSLDVNNWEKAFRLTVPLLRTDGDSIVSMLKELNMPQMANLLDSTVFMPLAERVLAHAMASYNVPLSKSGNVFQIKANDSTNGRRVNISADALQLWQVESKPIKDIMGNPMKILQKNPCIYWKELLKNNFKDNELEQFFSEHFPNDIPDEWSNEECLKSHGIDTSAFNNSSNPWIPAFLLMIDNS